MSATNRGAKRKESDFYATPIDAIDALLKNYDFPNYLGSAILEPSAGNGIIIETLRNYGYTNHIHAIEIREEEKENLKRFADSVVISDFLDADPDIRFDTIIGNPPFSLAQEFVDKSLSLLNPGGRLIFLLRTSFLESQKRFEWWQDKPPTRLYVLNKRPSFTGKGTDAASYSWFIWEKSRYCDQFVESQEIKVI